MMKDAMWLGVPRAEIEEKKIYHGDMNGRFAYYRLTVDINENGALRADLSASSRYRLWVNGEPVLSGPCRSSETKHYYETADLSRYLRPGRNVFAAQVLLSDPNYIKTGPGEMREPLHSVSPLPVGHRLALEGKITDQAGNTLADITTGRADWKVWLDNTHYLVREEINANMGALTEHIDFRKTFADWKCPEFDDSSWKSAEIIEAAAPGFEMNFGLLKPLRLEERPIPLMYEVPGVLSRELGEPVFADFGNKSENSTPGGGVAGADCNDYIIVGPNQKISILWDGENLFNAYFAYKFEGGRDSEVSFTYFEKFTAPEGDVKRDDYINGVIGKNGQTDTIILAGDTIYEPFWYRTMRFLRVEIETKNEPLKMYRPGYKKTGYPLNAGSFAKSSEEWVEKVYAMCQSTLEACMMDSYMDCPFWEQMQYPMDTRLQAMFTYICSTDTKLAKKALSDFHDSMLPMGLIQGRAPSSIKQIISTFSLHYIFMMTEYYKRTGDIDTIKQYRSDADMILEYYDRHIGDEGLVHNLGYWEFVDWQPTWLDNFGVPAACKKGPSTIINLMYGYALLCAADINEATGRRETAGEYRLRQQHITDTVQKLCWDDKRGMYREGPDYYEFTQHAQSWAVLNGMLEGTAAADVMHKAFSEADVLKCCFSTCYELFRACEIAGCYELTKAQMDWWIDLLGENCLTCPETPTDSRSECHAWSALPMYELLGVIAGVRREFSDPYFVKITPHMDYLNDIEGSVVTECGDIKFSYKKDGGKLSGVITLPEGMSGEFVLEDAVKPLHPGENII